MIGPASVASAAEVRILALGDSYTIGEGVSITERWPARLTTLLHARGLPVTEPTIVARTGWTSDELARGLDEAAPRGPYALVTLQIGVNDQYRGRTAAEYRQQLRVLLQRATRFAGGRASAVIVLSIPDWSVTPFAANSDCQRIAVEIDAFNLVTRDEAAWAAAAYVDVTPASRRAANDAALLAGDGLHPSATMHDDWARLVLPVALERLALRAGG